jgi:hypothetical protein
MDRDAISWRDGDWLGDTEIVEILEAGGDAELTPPTQPRPAQPLSENLVRHACNILAMIENNDAGKGRILLDPKDVDALREIAKQLGVIARELPTP